MSEVTQHAPGSFCWVELSTTDANGAKKFYTGLFDWTIQDIPIGPDMVYTELQIRQRNVAALCKQQPAEAAAGVPSHWQCYVAAEDAEAIGRKAVELGGKLILPAMDVFDYGRMAVIQDPTGAVFSVWQARKHIGAEIVGETGSMCWHELYTTDTDTAGRFYTGLFGWGVKPSPEYSEFQNNGTSMAGMMAITPQMGPMPPCWGVYFTVDDCDAAAEKAKALGGKVLMGPGDIPHVGRFAVIQDPQGAVFSIIKLNQRM
jgi:hypothetical protein